jgi:hypothetical protein
MPDELETNAIGGEGRRRSTEEGDIPDAIRRRYYVDGRRGAGIGFYADARIQTPAFRDRGGQLIAARGDPNAVRDMTAIAQHRGWSTVAVRGSVDFRREAWLAAMTIGIDVRGYRPTERDLQELERREAAQVRREARAPARSDGVPAAVRQKMAIVESVVRARVPEPSAQDRILNSARERIARWLEQGARFEPIDVIRGPAADRHTDRRRERQRGH